MSKPQQYVIHTEGLKPPDNWMVEMVIADHMKTKTGDWTIRSIVTVPLVPSDKSPNKYLTTILMERSDG